LPSPRPSSKRRKNTGDRTDVSRIEFENIEGVVRGNAEQLVRLKQQLDAISRQIADLTRVVGGRSKS
jgi:hypothetical protein